MFQTGMDVLLEERADLLKGRRVGLLAHPASVNRLDVHSALLLRDSPDIRLTCLYGPEHGFYGYRGAGEEVGDERHPSWHVPIYSLYGETRRPTPEMFEPVDVVVADLQDLGVRCYTYVSTLRHLLEAAAEQNVPVVVTDRPVPLPDTVDGPMLDPAFESFVGYVPAPLVYGMTPGETARWLVRRLDLDLDLEVVPMRGYRRDTARQADWPEWIPPSPALRNWESARCYPVTVCCEALPALDNRRKTVDAFQVLTAVGIDASEWSARLREAEWPGVHFEPYYDPEHAGREGVRIRVTRPRDFRPVRTAVVLLRMLGDRMGDAALWEREGTREDFFDRLMGADRVRRGLRSGASAETIAAEWEAGQKAFRDERSAALLYEPADG